MDRGLDVPDRHDRRPEVRSARRPEVRSSRLFLPLLALVLFVTCAVAAGPALGYESWEHGGAGESTCNSSGCHQDHPPSNTACVTAACHGGMTTSGSQLCWQCHEPGNAPTIACAGSCHLYRESGEDPKYDVAFTHGVSPHLGASGYGKACADCHKDGIHHDAAAATEPSCVDCHNGALAKLPPASHNDGKHTVCASCHDGMTIPAGGDCAACHVGNPSSGGPQVTFTNDLSCDDAGCHGKIKNHVGTSITKAACTDCHITHYQALGACTKCHTDPQSFHHGTSSAIALGQCASCHNGGIAKAPSNHTGYGADCVSCHTGMDKPSLADCASCHVGKPGSSAPQVTYTSSLACADSGCHAKIKNHEGTPITKASCTTCHDAHYEAVGTCSKCHDDVDGLHHGTAKPIPLNDCAGCHDGSIAAAPTGHSGYGTGCTSCHNGMDIPSGQCMTCHDKAQGKVPAVKSTNDLSCGDASCHAKVRNHEGTPIAKASCTTCHQEHYKTLGTCATCHGDTEKYHHGTTKATPLAKCETCHDGKIAVAKQSHAGAACSVCHDAMTPAAVPVKCQTCHSAGKFGSQKCTACHSTASGMFGDKEQVHAKDPKVACTTCHKPMYADVGGCATCHGSHAQAHHGTATPADSTLKASVSDRRIKKGERITVGGSLSGVSGALGGQKVTLQGRTSSKAAYKTISTFTTKADGTFGRSLKPRTSTQYRLIYAARGDAGLTQQPAVKLLRVKVTR